MSSLYALKPHKLTIEQLVIFGNKINVPYLVDPDKLHVSIIEVPKGFTPNHIQLPVYTRGTKLSKWERPNRPSCLVLELPESMLRYQADMMVRTLGFKPIHPVFKPHITLSYDADQYTLPIVKSLSINVILDEEIIIEEFE